MRNPFKRSEKSQEVLILKPGGDLVVKHTVTHQHRPRPRPASVYFKLYDRTGQTWQMPGFRLYGQTFEQMILPEPNRAGPPAPSDWHRLEILFDYGDS